MTEKRRYPLNEEAWSDWVTYRREMKFKKYKTDRPKNILMVLPYDAQQECVDYSRDREYQGLFPEGFLPKATPKQQFNMTVDQRGAAVGLTPRPGETYEGYEQRIKGLEQREAGGYLQ